MVNATQSCLRRRREHVDVEQLLRVYRFDHRSEDRDVIAESYEWLVMQCVRRMSWRREPIDDLAQVARLGLLAAIERFDPDRGIQFRTYATSTIVGTLYRYYRSAWQLKVPRGMQERHLTVRRAVEQLTSSLNRSPTFDEIADLVGVGRDDVLEALEVGDSYSPLSLSEALFTDDVGTVEHYLGMPDLFLESSADRAELRAAMNVLPDRQRAIVFMHFYDGRTQAEIGRKLGISQVQVSRLLTAALRTMRTCLAA